MPVFLITIHAYRSWRPDNGRGYVRRGEGILPPDKGMAEAYDRNASSLPARFGPDQQEAALKISRDACLRRGWRLHAAAMEPTHVHLLVSWRDQTRSTLVCGKLKNLISRELNLAQKAKRKWLSRGASRKRVNDRRHFEHLVRHYLPKHRGLVWVEGMPPPGPPASADG